MTNIIAEYGSTSYFNDKFSGAMFGLKQSDGSVTAAVLRQALSSNEVQCRTFSGKVGKITTNDVIVPGDYFSGLNVFRTPTLGWRSAKNGRLLLHVSKRNNRSCSVRGVSARGLSTLISGITSRMIGLGLESPSYYAEEGVLTKLVMEPEYTEYNQGIELMREGKILSFVPNERVAVQAINNDVAHIYLGTVPVGRIDLNSKVNKINQIFESLVKDVIK